MENNWTINLLVGDGDVTYYNKFPLVYVASTQERYQLNQDDGGIEGQEPAILYHVSDNQAPIPARITEMNKTGRWVISVFDDENTTPTWDNILNNFHAINRHMSGADSTAARHTVDGTAQNVRIAIKPQGASNTTYYNVQSGWADVSRSYYTKASQQTTSQPAQRGAWFIPINFVFESGGYGDAFTLNNALPSSPHFIEFNTSADLADGWDEIGTPTETKDTTTWLIGGSSQKLITDDSTSEGIESDAVTASTSTNAVLYFWVATDGNAADDLTIELEDGSNNSIDTAVISFSAAGIETSSVSDKHRIGSDGTNWYRVVVSGANTTAANFVARVYRASGDATQISTYFIDGAYLQTGTLTAPDGWCSAGVLKNRYDTGVDEGNINYLDVWGIPGDLPAFFTSKFTAGSVSFLNAYIIFGKDFYTGSPNTHWLESSDFNGSSGTWTDTTAGDAVGRTDNHYLRLSTAGVFQTALHITTGVDAIKKYIEKPRRIYGIFRTTTAAGVTVNLTVGNAAKTYLSSNATLTSDDTWQLLDLGLLNVGDAHPLTEDDIYDSGSPFINTKVNVVDLAGGKTFDIDALLAIPIDDLLITKAVNPLGANGQLWVIGEKNKVSSSSDVDYVQSRGGLSTLITGGEMTRILLLGAVSTTSLEHDISQGELTVTIDVTPRTSHLLGTS